MKLLLTATMIVLPASIAAPSWADPGIVLPQSTTASSPHTQTLQPLSVDSRTFTADPLSGDSQQSNRSNHLSDQAEQINGNLNTRQPPRSQPLNDLLDLPDGMVIRGSSRGGVGLGREF